MLSWRAVLRLAFIAHIAYTYWLGLSRDRLSLFTDFEVEADEASEAPGFLRRDRQSPHSGIAVYVLTNLVRY